MGYRVRDFNVLWLLLAVSLSSLPALRCNEIAGGVKNPSATFLEAGHPEEALETAQRQPENEMLQSDLGPVTRSDVSETEKHNEREVTQHLMNPLSSIRNENLIEPSRSIIDAVTTEAKMPLNLTRMPRNRHQKENFSPNRNSRSDFFSNLFFLPNENVSNLTENPRNGLRNTVTSANEIATDSALDVAPSRNTESILNVLFGDPASNTLPYSIRESGTPLSSVLFGRSIAQRSSSSEKLGLDANPPSENKLTNDRLHRQSRSIEESTMNLDLITEENQFINEISEDPAFETTETLYPHESSQTSSDNEISTEAVDTGSNSNSPTETEFLSPTEKMESIDLNNSASDSLRPSKNSESTRNVNAKEKFPHLPAPIVSSSVIEAINITPAQDEINSVPANSVTLIDQKMNIRAVETSLLNSSTVSPILVSMQEQETSARRIQRSIDYDVGPSDIDGYHLTTFVPVEGRSANKLKKSSRRSDPEPDIDDIIQGIMHLLGGNVKIDAESSVQTHLTTFGGGQPVSSTRTNDRGPPRLPLNPFNFFNSRPTRTRPPIRRPISQSPHGAPSRARPSFVANTLPPFIATLPPQLDTPRPQGSLGKPTLTAYPIPVNLIPESAEISVSSPKVQLPSSTSAVHSLAVGEQLEPEQNEETTDVNVTQEITPALPLSSSETEGHLTFAETTTPILTESDTEKSKDTDVTTTPVYSVELESSLNIKNTPSLSESVYSSPLPPDLVSRIQNSPSATELRSSTNFKSTIRTSSNSLISTSVSSVSPKAPLGKPHSSHLPAESSHTQSHTLSKSTESLEDNTRTKTRIGSPSNNQFINPRPGSLSPTQTHQFRPAIPTATRRYKPRPGVPNPSQTRPPRPGIPTAIREPQPRPGVVLDAAYRPGQVVTGPLPRPTDLLGQVFDVTVSAQQGFGGQVSPVRPPHLPSYVQQRPFDYLGPARGEESLLVTPTDGDDGFVSIDGRKTYFDLFPTATAQALPQQTVGLGIGMVIPEEEMIDGEFPDLGPSYNIPAVPSNVNKRPQLPLPPVRPQQPPVLGPYHTSAPAAALSSSGTPQPFKRRPSTPSIRIDTCIVGDDSTCQEQLQEVCRTEGDVSSCYCKPGTDRRRPRTMCKKMVMLEISVKVNRVGNQRISWSGNYANPESEEYQLLEWEAQKAIESAFKKSALKSVYLNNKVEKFYTLGGNVIVNSTVKLEDNPSTRTLDIKRTLQRHLIKVIQAHNNNIGNSALWVDGPLDPIPVVDDVNECSLGSLNDCHEHATCINEFATFACRCLPGYTDRYRSDPERMGRHCESCSADHCHKRGECKIEDGKKVCECKGSYYGDRCEVDGEVVAVAVGASAAAVIIILMTLLFLCMWSRRWKIQDQKSETLRRGGFLARAAAGGHYLQQKFAMVGQPQPQQFGPTMEDHIRWAQMSEAAMAAQQGLYGTLPGSTATFYAAANHGFPNRSNFPSRPYRNYPESVYSRVSRTLSNPMTFRNKLMARIRSFFSRGPKSAVSKPGTGDMSAFIVPPNPNTMNMQQMMALHAHLAATNQNDHLTGNGPSLASSAPAPLFKNHRQMGGAAEYGQLCPPPQFGGSQFGLQHLNPTMLPMVAPPSMAHQNFSRTPSTYGQYPGPASLSMSQSGASRATVQLCGPSSSGLETSSEEEEPRRVDRSGGPSSCYQIPRPKSRASVGVGRLAPPPTKTRLARSYTSLLF